MRKAYTKAGDEGFTKDYSGKRIPKDDIRIVVAGKIDSLQSAIDLLILKSTGKTKKVLEEIQKKLWQTAGEISCADKLCVVWPIEEKDLEMIEKFADSLGEPPKKFVRFDTLKAICYNEARIRCRELETFSVKLLREKQIRPVAYKWINRLSSLFFMLSYKSSKH